MLRELALVFLKLGFTAFGGTAAHTAMMENEFVGKRHWLTREEFLDLLGAASLIPGPSSSELALYIGQRRAGWRGFILAGLCFVLPASLIVAAFAWAYVRYHNLPAVSSILYGIKPVVIAIIVQAIWGLSRAAVKSTFLGILGAGAAIAALFGMNIPLLLLAFGLISATARSTKFLSPLLILALSFLIPLKHAWAMAATVSKVPVTLSRIFLFFLKVGATAFGGGYVLLAFLRADLVQHWHWLTELQLLDAVAVGQFTPGPVFTTATFIGYLLKGPWGALLATIGIFLPAFLLVAASGAFIPRIRQSRWTGAFLDGVNVASIALMGVVTWHLGRASIIDFTTILLAALSLFVLIRYKLNSMWLIIIGGMVGFFAYHFPLWNTH